jgi:ABC-type uncharacterized transport system permease subunit
MAAKDILEPATLLGLGMVAVWVWVRYPRLRPSSLIRAMMHVALSFGLFALLPYLISPSLNALGKPLGLFFFVVVLLVPTLTYVLFSWLGLMAKLHDLADSKPSGGHRAPAEAR